ncbi:cytochrome b-c1 complex subunit 7 [Dunaliella salina]|uniref:Cytochrome b-c1 complex subunit 7 n=1 Tax=Dunaliella salina TaxID=3046 RepID=A0ABQ7GRD5_DUNSA|nr:cytochrome b-c1 complex subunit 7 [Dunaliella salina]|eukprot:KAF5837166.1 cytochrome b-c1 complex subunit 7 [Dunaliella salina]
MSALVKQLFKPLVDAISRPYAARVNKTLASYGLRYDDLYDPLKDEDVAEALRRLPPDVIMQRNARLRRAIDLDLKHDHLHGELLAQQTPDKCYLQETLEEVRQERRERAQLGAPAPYTRIHY